MASGSRKRGGLAEGTAFGDGDLHLGKAPRGDGGNAPTRWALETFQKKPEGGGRGKRGAGVEEGAEKSTGRGSGKAMERRTAGEPGRETPGMGWGGGVSARQAGGGYQKGGRAGGEREGLRVTSGQCVSKGLGANREH